MYTTLRQPWILQSVAAPINVGELELSVGLTIGGCLYPEQATSKRELLMRADAALYEVKRSGKKGVWGWYSAVQ